MNLKLIGTLSTFLLAVTAYSQHADFSGNWVFNKQKSTMGQVPPIVVFDRVDVRQSKDSIFLTPPNAATVDYALDGTPSERLWRDSIKLISSFTWSGDKNNLIKSQSYLSAANEAILKKIKEVWHLSGDGAELVIERNFESFNKNEPSYSIKAVYDKQ